VLSVDCNNFFLKFILWVPADHKLLSFRLAIWAFSAIAATKEYYEYVTNKYCYRFGPFVWLTCYTLLIEISIIVKFGRTMFHAPFPWYVQLMWVCIAVLVVIGFVIAFYNQNKNSVQDT
jgi:phosphatidylserine synthase 2